MNYQFDNETNLNHSEQITIEHARWYYSRNIDLMIKNNSTIDTAIFEYSCGDTIVVDQESKKAILMHKHQIEAKHMLRYVNKKYLHTFAEVSCVNLASALAFIARNESIIDSFELSDLPRI